MLSPSALSSCRISHAVWQKPTFCATHKHPRAVTAHGTIPGASSRGAYYPSLPTQHPINGKPFAPAEAPQGPNLTYPDDFSGAAGMGSNGNGGSALSNGNTVNNGALAKSEYSKFVQFFRQAGPYIEGHRGRVFVIVVPGNVSRAESRQLLQ